MPDLTLHRVVNVALNSREIGETRVSTLIVTMSETFSKRTSDFEINLFHSETPDIGLRQLIGVAPTPALAVVKPVEAA